MALNPDTKIRYRSDNIYGQPVYMTRRTGAHLDWTREKLAQFHPGSDVAIIQGAFNTTVEASAGTHDYAACLDVYIPGWAFIDMQKFFRRNGWAAWWRYPPSFGNHIHMITLGYTTRVGIYVPGQVDDYYAHKTGLVGHYADNTWHPADIDATIFNYADYAQTKGDDDMPTAKDLLDTKLGAESTVRDALLASLNTHHALAAFRDNLRQRDTELAATLNALIESGKDDATKEQLMRVRDTLRADIGTKDTSLSEGH